jgi:hypothetical protein
VLELLGSKGRFERDTNANLECPKRADADAHGGTAACAHWVS